MIIYKCDGSRYSDNTECGNTHRATDGGDMPKRWISINGNIKNGLSDARLIEGNGLIHFCSRECLEFYLFKNNKADAIIKQHKLLLESKKTIDWMLKNMKVDDQNLQSDAFNIPTNTAEALGEYVSQFENSAGQEEY